MQATYVNGFIGRLCTLDRFYCINIQEKTVEGICYVTNGEPADRVFTASSRNNDASLITLDQVLLNYGQEGWLWAKALDLERLLLLYTIYLAVEAIVRSLIFS